MGLQGLRSASGVRAGAEEMKNHADTNSSNTMLRSARRRALSSTGLVGAMLLTALVTSAATPALADGGSGGNGSMGAGGTGGIGFTGVNGGDGGGGNGSMTGAGGGGGGGAGGGAGGAGGNVGGAGEGGSGGAGGTSESPDGQHGQNSGLGAAAGGGGGGFNGNGSGTTTITNSSALNGGTGGGGGSAVNAGGGGGGAGGFGAVVTGSGSSTNSSSITGGNGGSGGTGGFLNGNGGDGGVGVQFAPLSTSGASFNNSGNVLGGSGGQAGMDGGGGGVAGAGGAGIVGSGLAITNSGTIAGGVSGDGATMANAITFTGGSNTLTLQIGSVLSGNLAINGGGSLTFNQTTAQTIFNAITGNGSVIQNGTGTLLLRGASTYTGGTTISSGSTLQVGVATVGTPGAITSSAIGTGTLTFDGGTLQSGGSSLFDAVVVHTNGMRPPANFTIANAGVINTTGGTIDANGTIFTYSGAIGNGNGNGNGTTGSLTVTDSAGGGTVVFSGANTYSGATIVGDGTHSVTLQGGATNTFSANSAVTVNAGSTLDIGSFNQTIGSLAGNGTVTNNGALTGSSAVLAVGNDNTSTVFSGVIHDGAQGEFDSPPTIGLTKIGTGTQTLTGVNTYTGSTTVTGGTLEVDGSIASSTVVVSGHGTLSGTGLVGATQIGSGGTLAPGNTMSPTAMLTVSGSLAFQSGALYVVAVKPSFAAGTSVLGTAGLTGGSVQTVFAAGSYVAKSYDILHASGGLGGTKFNGITGNVPTGFTESLSYTTTDVMLNLTMNMGSGGATAPSELNRNQQSAANTINAFFNNGGKLTPGFVNLAGLSGSSLGNALNQVSGEAATGAEKGAFQMTTQFLNLLLDPFAGGGVGGGMSPSGFAPEQQASLPPDVALAYASVLKAQPAPANFDARWNVWGSAFGGTSNASGNAAVGSNHLTAGDYGVAAGADYRVTPNTVVGFALAGGNTNWSLAQGLGGGRSDAFQAGLYSKSTFGPAYLSAAFSFANQWFKTSRVALGDPLTANFQGQDYAGRIEGGYRFALPVTAASFGITPYAAVQTQLLHTPTYNETDTTGGGFGLNYGAMSTTDTRSELGARFDNRQVVDSMPLMLRGRVAWAHDWVSDPSLQAAFQTLPGSSFIVNGASLPKDSALITASAELRLNTTWSLLAKFDGEFARNSETYAGTGTLRASW